MAQKAPTAVAFGNFDGVHLGHRALLSTLRTEAARFSAQTKVVTFDPHPLSVLDPAHAPEPIDAVAARRRRLSELGVDEVVVLPFDEAFAAKSARWFAEEVLCDAGAAKVIVVGYDCRFGRGGEGDIALLRQIAGPQDIAVVLFEAVEKDGGIVSSSRVRDLVRNGRMRDAAALLGRSFELSGTVALGDQIGRKIGFPTANIDAPRQIQPGPGVYACQLLVGDQVLHGVCNCGFRPTVTASRQWRVEVHCFDFAGDLYNRDVTVSFAQRIRGEQRFEGLDALKAQISEDCAAARRILGYQL